MPAFSWFTVKKQYRIPQYRKNSTENYIGGLKHLDINGIEYSCTPLKPLDQNHILINFRPTHNVFFGISREAVPLIQGGG